MAAERRASILAGEEDRGEKDGGSIRFDLLVIERRGEVLVGEIFFVVVDVPGLVMPRRDLVRGDFVAVAA